MYAKVRRHRLMYKDLPVSKVCDTADTTSWSIGTLQDGEYVMVNGTNISSSQLPRPTAHASLYFTAPVASVDVSGSYTIGKWIALSSSMTSVSTYDFAVANPNKLTYSGSTWTNSHKKFFGVANFSVTASHLDADSSVDFAFAVNNAVQSSSIQRYLILSSSGQDAVNLRNCQVNLNTVLPLTKDQYVNLWAKSNTATVSLHTISGSVSIIQL